MYSQASQWLSELTQPLVSKFGDRLTIYREGNAVRWSYAGDSAIVEMRSGTAVAARFISRPSRQLASVEAVSAVYAAPDPMYPLTRSGVARMVDDLAEFFSGTREPRFTFVDAVVEVLPG